MKKRERKKVYEMRDDDIVLGCIKICYVVWKRERVSSIVIIIVLKITRLHVTRHLFCTPVSSYHE